ncbi:MAG: hypothetical protein LBI35_04030 [Burkholderiales bacterium]|jgi:endonuclease/exonuclease/phosphatase family metal-dependent hydrolase|nr:hypothetical protein [Burkholderiales bacterium]
MRLSVATYNIHKGVSHLRRRPKMPELRDYLRATGIARIGSRDVVRRIENRPSALLV